MDTGDAQVGGRSCVETIWTSVEGVLGQEGAGWVKTKYVTIIEGY